MASAHDQIHYWSVDLQGTDVTAVFKASRNVLQQKFKSIGIQVYTHDERETYDFFVHQMGWRARACIEPGSKTRHGATSGTTVGDGLLLFHNPKLDDR